MTFPMRALLLALLLAAWPSLAQVADATPLPEWDRLTPAQREALIEPVRQRWNSEPEQRPRMLRHAQRWQSMTPEQRRAAHRGMRRFHGLTPEQRAEARVLFQKMRSLDPQQRAQLREQWARMTPQQRQRWIKDNTPAGPAAPGQ